MLERYMEDLIAEFPNDFFHDLGFVLKGRQRSFNDVGRFDLLFSDRHDTNILMELKARVAKYEDASQLAKYKDELGRRGVENVLMWLVSPHIPPSVRDFLDRIGIQYSEIHEAEFRQVAARYGFEKKYPTELEGSTAIFESAKQPKQRHTEPRLKEATMYELSPDFNKARLEDLIREFETAGKRTVDASLATKLRNELLNSDPPRISSATTKQLAKWCDTKGQLYFDGMEVARKISELLFGRVVDRTKLGV